MVNSHSMRAHPCAAIAPDFAARTVLPVDMAVKGPRFKSRTWAQSLAVREILDQIYIEAATASAPRPEPVASSESIVMSGVEIENRVTVGGHVVKQTRVVAAFESPELSIVEPATPPEDSLRNAAGEALAALNRRRPVPRVIAAPAPSEGRPVMWAAVLVVVALGVAVWFATRGAL